MFGFMAGIEVTLGLFAIWNRFFKVSNKKILIHGTIGEKEIPFLDGQLDKYLHVDPNWIEAKSHAKLLSAIRYAVNTKAFSTILKKIIVDKNMFNGQIQGQFKVL